MFEFSKSSGIKGFKMVELSLREVFRLADGVTILACEGNAQVSHLVGRKGVLVADGEIRQEVVLTGERHMLNQTARRNQMALETKDTLNLTAEEVQSGRWSLVWS
jgi:hypothetical protein